MIKAVIFDLNGIFIQSMRLSERFERDFKVPVADFIPKLSEIMTRVRLPGAGPAFSYWEPVLREWAVPMSEERFWNYWFKAEGVSQKMVGYARDLKSRGIKVFILSNNFKERAEYYGQYPWLKEVVDKVYFSWQTGLVKPDTKAWQLILDENQLKADECIFFDDQDKNLRAAKSIGIESHAYINEDELIQIVDQRTK